MKMKKIASVITSTVLLASTLAGAVSLVSCGGGSDPNVIRYVAYTGGGSLDDSGRIVRQVNKRMEELGLDFKIDIEYIGYNTYAGDITTYFSTGEDFDMCYSGSLLSGLSYSTAVSRGYFADITSKLPEYAPELYNSMLAEGYWEAAKIGGKIYGVINEQIFARSVGLAIDKEEVAPYLMVDTTGDGVADEPLTQEAIDKTVGTSYEITCYDVINLAMEYIQSNETISPKGKIPSTTLVIGNAWDDIIMQSYGLDALGTSSYTPGIIRAVDGETTVINQYKDPIDPTLPADQQKSYFEEFADFCRSVHEKGWIHEDQLKTPNTANQRVRMTGTYYPYVAENTLSTTIGREFEIFQFGSPLLSSVNVTSSMTAINKRSKKVDKCLKFLNALYTDKTLYNLIAVGEEGIDYYEHTAYDENDQEYTYITYNQNGKYKPMADWAFGCELNTYAKENYASNWVEVIKDINKNGVKSPAYGFTYMPTKEESDAMNWCNITVGEYMNYFLNGSYAKDKSTKQIIAEMNEKIDKHVAKIIPAKQKQLNDFLANKA